MLHEWRDWRRFAPRVTSRKRLLGTALYGKHLARPWGGLYDVTIVLAIYLNAFVAVIQAFAKIRFLHALAPTGKEPPFLIAQLLILALFVVIGVIAFRRFPVRKPQI